ncbi:NACHT domain-containing protein [Calothrix sp. NIES-2098]|uniref:NACHT domain-containing protein n=1 Tax=Calothrix sp. NIES-2098 TaxID=1954171 RepID=UPI000B60CCB8|nr:putative signal transduction protein with Nacht domain [Calothrix sp. NIES-2098]
MTGRSLSCSPEGIQQAKRALIRYSLTQKALAEDLGITRQPVGKFFTGKPVDRNLFVQICDRLDLEWEEIVTQPASETKLEQTQDTHIDITFITQEIREKIKPLILERCGTMRVLDMTQPVGLEDIYTNVNILEKITGQRRKEIAEFLKDFTDGDFERFGLGKITEKRVSGQEAVEKHPKLMILGKPGAGKTTFLKYLAIQCIAGKFQSERVPIFVTLKNFAEATNKPGLLQYICEDAINHISTKISVIEKQFTLFIQDVINHGNALILLDGLDEVREEDNSRILKEIREFSDRFQHSNFVMTCRIAAREYTFEKFTEVEVADFDDKQIKNFANKWFQGKAVKAESFIKRLEDNNRIKQLATSPLLLTLLCLAFEESGDFPANRSELYKEGLDALLKKWDAKRGIQRDQIYRKLSVQRKEDLLSKIALITFERGDYFFKQKMAEQYITNYIRNLPGANADEEALQLDSEEVLRSIEHHHGLIVARAKGIYSYSHLTFHEYFTAREFVVVRQSSEEALQNLVNYVTEKRWREVFLLAVGMSPSADRLLLLMKEKIDAIVSVNQRLQQFLVWVRDKSCSVDVTYKAAAVRAFYFGLGIDRDLDLGLDRDLSLDLLLDLDLSLNLDLSLSRTLSLSFGLSISLRLSISRTLFHTFSLSQTPELKDSLQQLKEKIPNTKDSERFLNWWKTDSQYWSKELREIIIKYRNIGHDWEFTTIQKTLLQQYYDANKFLVHCLNSDCYVSREVRQYVENTLLLPIDDIKKHQQQFCKYV